MTVTNEFERMALSFCGCEGGNLGSPVWICGLEPGVKRKGRGGAENKISEEEMKPLPEPGAWNKETIRDNLKNQYNNKAAWFFCYLFGWKINQGSDEYKHECEKHKLFCEDGIGFKMNMFPIPFQTNDLARQWSEKLKEQKGFDNYSAYQEWCVKHRGEYFYKLVEKHNPKIIVCTGVRYPKEFMNFFRCEPGCIKEYPKNLENPEHCYTGITNNKSTIVVVTPFFGGAKGILGYDQMKALASWVNNFAKNRFNDPNWMHSR